MNAKSNIGNSTTQSISSADGYDLHAEAYDEGAFFATTDWQYARKETERPCVAMPVAPEYTSMADHCSQAWAFVSRIVCPDWEHDEAARCSFFVGYEDAATELADAGEAGYETLAEAGTVAATEGWQLQCAPWRDRASAKEKGRRAVQAAWDGAAAWQARAEASGDKRDERHAGLARIRAEVAGEYMLGSEYLSEAGSTLH